MKMYCKAYSMAELRRFPGWADGAQPAEQDIADDEYVYLCDDHRVVADPIRQEPVLFAAVTPEWKEFAAKDLGFAIPDDLSFAYTEPAQA